jgi:hypothetical protein
VKQLASYLRSLDLMLPAFGCLALERRLPERVRRSSVGVPFDEGEPLPKPAPA